MKTLLKYFLLLNLFLGFNESEAQTQQYQQHNSKYMKSLEVKMITHTDKTGYVYDWKLSNKTCYGCGSFYVCVIRTAEADEKGLYYFYIYFWSNSYYGTGEKSSTYVTDINIYFVSLDGNRNLILGPYYFLSYPKTPTFNGYNLAATLYGTDPYQIINITWGQITAY